MNSTPELKIGRNDDQAFCYLKIKITLHRPGDGQTCEKEFSYAWQNDIFFRSYYYVTQISGTQGTAEPGTIVTIRNLSAAGLSVSVIAESDGSFGTAPGGTPVLSLEADAGDKIEMEFRDDAGNITKFFPGPFRDDDGRTIINSDGGVVEGPGGIRAVILPGAVPDGTPVKLEQFGKIRWPVRLLPVFPT